MHAWGNRAADPALARFPALLPAAAVVCAVAAASALEKLLRLCCTLGAGAGCAANPQPAAAVRLSGKA